MIDQIKSHIETVKKFNASSEKELEEFRISYLGKKGILNDFFSKFKTVPNEQKKILGKLSMNSSKKQALKLKDLKLPLKINKRKKGFTAI